jgi:hypothetical protein
MSMLQTVGMAMRGSAWARGVDGFAAVFGAASAVAGLGAAIVIPYGIALQLTEASVRVQTRIYQLISFEQATYLLNVIGLIVVPGALGLTLAWRGWRSVERVSLAGMAARFSIMGLACDGLLLAALLALLVYRWITWG